MKRLLLLALLSPPQGVDVSLEAEPLRSRVGEPIALRLLVRHEPGVEIEWPDLATPLASFRVRSDETTEKEAAGAVLAERKIVLLPALPGTVEIPPQVVRFRGRTGEGARTTEPIRLEIVSVLAEGEADLRPTRGPLAPPAPWWPWALGGAALLAAALLLGRVLRRRALAPSPPVPPEPPHRRALRRLEALAAQGIEGEEAIGRFYDEVSAVVRFYLEGRFGLRAPERTTEEFLREASADGLFSVDHRLLLREFLEACDLVKFARHRPGTAAARGALAAARRFVEETRPDRAVAQGAPA